MNGELKTVVENVVRSFSLVKNDIININNYLAELNSNMIKVEMAVSKGIAEVKKTQQKHSRDISKQKDTVKALRAEIRFMQKKLKQLGKKK